MDTIKYKELREVYGEETLELVRKLETISRKIGKSRSHLRFNLQCKHTNIIPKYLKIKSPIHGVLAKNVIHNAEILP